MAVQPQSDTFPSDAAISLAKAIVATGDPHPPLQQRHVALWGSRCYQVGINILQNHRLHSLLVWCSAHDQPLVTAPRREFCHVGRSSKDFLPNSLL